LQAAKTPPPKTERKSRKSGFAHKVALPHTLASFHCILGGAAPGKKGKWSKPDVGAGGNIY